MLNKPTNFTNCPIQEIPSSEGMITTGGIPSRRRVALYGIVLRVTVIGPKVRWFIPSLLRRESRAVGPMSYILRHVKETFEVWKRYFGRQTSSFHSPDHPALLLCESAGMTVRELWWTNKESSPVDNVPPWLFMLIYHLQDEQ
jgi:hypothetical protein